MFPWELTAVWSLMKGRHPGARVLIAATWSRSGWGWEEGCRLNLQTRRTVGKWLVGEAVQ